MPPCLRIFVKLITLVLLATGLFFLVQNVNADEYLPTSVEVLVSCGDGIAEASAGEVCDPGDPPGIPADIGTSTCADFNDIFGNPFVSGDLGCSSDCTSFATSSCYTCGNTYKENREECDTNDFGNATCITMGYSGGSLICTADCRISLVNCEVKTEEGGIAGSGVSGGGAGSYPGFNPGSDEEIVTKLVVYGKSYPNADVHILKDGAVIGIVHTDAKADFYFEDDEVEPGVASFGFWSQDASDLKSTLLTLTFRVLSGAVTTITGVYISPTIEVGSKSVRHGEKVRIYGQTIPETNVKVHIHSDEEFVEEAKSSGAGDWELLYDTTPLAVDFHTAKALFEINEGENIIKSGFSRSVSFHVGTVGGVAACPEADLNHDGRVNLTDFSILLFYWGTDNECADQNQNGIVDLVDFSIMMYYWTG